MWRQKIALNKLETLIRKRQLLPDAFRRVIGADSVSRRMAKLPDGNVRDSALTRLLRQMRVESRTDLRELTPRQLRIEELSGKALARGNNVRARSGPWAGATLASRAAEEAATQTPLYRVARDLGVPYRTAKPYDSRTLRMYYNPAESANRPIKVVSPGGRRRNVPRSSLRSTVIHELAEADSFRRGNQLHHTLESLPPGKLRTEVHRQEGLVPFSTHHDTNPIIKQYGAHANMGWRRDAVGPSTSLAEEDVFGPGVALDPSEKALARIMRRVRVSPTGDFPAGGRHERAVRRLLVRELLAHPKKYAPDLRYAMTVGVSGARLHPDLERYLATHPYNLTLRGAAAP